MAARKFSDEIEKQIAEDYKNGMHVDTIMEKWGCTYDVLVNALKRQNVPKRIGSPQWWRKFPSELTQEQKEILNGNLLGDGNLTVPCSQTANSLFKISQTYTKIEYINYLYEKYSPFSLSKKPRTTKKPSTINGKIPNDIKYWDGSYLQSNELTTICHPIFTKQRIKWYETPFEKGGKKIVPLDLILTPLTCAIWACDDGSNNVKNRRYQLCTNGFTKIEVEFLINRLQIDLGIKSYLKIDNRGHPLIYIFGDETNKFIEIIKPFVYCDCFQYKVISRAKLPNGPPNTSGTVGVYLDKRRNKWFARGNGKYLGEFTTIEEAINVKKEWDQKNLPQ